MIHRGSGLCIDVGESIAGTKRVFINLGGDSYSSVPNTKRSRVSLAKFLRGVADMLEKHDGGCTGECGRVVDSEGGQIHFGDCPLAPKA